MRELVHVVERAVLLARGDELGEADLALRVREGAPRIEDLTLEAAERFLIERALTTHAGLVLAAAAIPTVVALPLLWTAGFDRKTEVTLTLAMGVGVAICVAAVYERVVRPLQTLGNLLAALRARDYSVRGRHDRQRDALGLALGELGALASELREERHRDEEAAAGLARVVEGIDVAVLATDRDGRVRVANRAAERALGTATVIGQPVTALGIAELFEVESVRTVRLALPGGDGPWQIRRSEVRLSGVPHRLVVLTDVGRALRAEEREAWRRLVRVLGHEINNSLGPIRSIADTLRYALAAAERAPDLDADLERGLAVIQRRSEALSRFMTSYARLARLPPPQPGTVEVAPWVRRAAEFETRVRVAVAPGPDLAVAGDGDQLDQLLINLVANAAEAVLETGAADGAGVRLRWSVVAGTGSAEIVVEDDGPGLAQTTNLFVPFVTTKPSGSGIGLVLSRQIAEAHGGTLVLRNRIGARGCEAVVSLPLAAGRDPD